MYEPSAEQAEKDKRTAFTSGIPHGVQFTRPLWFAVI